jgi:hypothetical protein
MMTLDRVFPRRLESPPYLLPWGHEQHSLPLHHQDQAFHQGLLTDRHPHNDPQTRQMEIVNLLSCLPDR